MTVPGFDHTPRPASEFYTDPDGTGPSAPRPATTGEPGEHGQRWDTQLEAVEGSLDALVSRANAETATGAALRTAASRAAARAAIGATLVAGANVTITVDDTANTITISAASGGPGTYT